MKREHGILLSITGLMFMIFYFILRTMQEFGVEVHMLTFVGIVLISVGMIYRFGYKKRTAKFLGYRR
jgi:uncharacterized membrane protein